jgi:hypothetical protein
LVNWCFRFAIFIMLINDNKWSLQHFATGGEWKFRIDRNLAPNIELLLAASQGSKRIF